MTLHLYARIKKGSRPGEILKKLDAGSPLKLALENGSLSIRSGSPTGFDSGTSLYLIFPDAIAWGPDGPLTDAETAARLESATDRSLDGAELFLAVITGNGIDRAITVPQEDGA